MISATLTSTTIVEPGPAPQPPGRQSRPAKAAATRVARAGMTLSGLGLAASLFGLVRLFETWRIGAHAPSNVVSVLGLRLSYPAANADAVVILLLAFVGFIVGAMVFCGMARELLVSHRVNRKLASTRPVRMGDVFVIEDDEPRAFCAGLLAPRVYVTTGAVDLLDAKALEAVLLHERHHAWRHDPLRLAGARVIAGALFFLPSLRRLHGHEQALAELGADESAVNAAPGNRSALARAMLGFIDAASDSSAGIDPARVDYVLGDPPSWSFPALLCVASLLTIGLVVAVAIIAGRFAAGDATFALPFLSSAPCVVMLAVMAVTGAVIVRSRPRNRSGARLSAR